MLLLIRCYLGAFFVWFVVFSWYYTYKNTKPPCITKAEFLAARDMDDFLREASGRIDEKEIKLTLKGRRIFIAANIHQNEELLSTRWNPAVLKMCQVFRHLGADIFVSIYESGSTDNTPLLLRKLAEDLNEVAVPNHIVTDGHAETKVQKLTWRDLPFSAKAWVHNSAAWHFSVQERIEKLAVVRNIPLEPLRNSTANYTDLLFINDVVFTTTDMLRLLAWRSLDVPASHRADLACGLDFVTWGETWRVFYDTWVARDIRGDMFSNDFPFSKHNLTTENLGKGNPVPAYCCWNGAALIDPKPFQSGALRFHASNLSANQMPESECYLFCNDLWRYKKNNAKVVIDPQIRLAYVEDIYQTLLNPPDDEYPLALRTWETMAPEIVEDLLRKSAHRDNTTKIQARGTYNKTRPLLFDSELVPPDTVEQNCLNFREDCEKVEYMNLAPGQDMPIWFHTEDEKGNGQCIGWRNTGSCGLQQPREQEHDRGCSQVIMGDMSGYCVCGTSRSSWDGDSQRHNNGRGQFHVPHSCGEEWYSFTCHSSCKELEKTPKPNLFVLGDEGQRETDGTCLGWESAVGCHPAGIKNTEFSKNCSQTIYSRYEETGGYCLCGNNTITQVMTCNDQSPPFTCFDKCKTLAARQKG